MANAAEEQVAWVRRQFYATVAEIGAIVLTILVSGWAALEAGKAATSAARSTKIAEDAVGVAREAADKQLRAYVSLVHAGVACKENAVKQTAKFTINIRQENHGQTPALNVRFGANVELLPHPLPADYQITHPGIGDGVNTVFPGQHFTVDRTYQASASKETEDIVRGDRGRRLYVTARVFYEDVFGVRYVTKACWSYEKLSGTDEERRFKTALFDYTDEYNTTQECHGVVR